MHPEAARKPKPPVRVPGPRATPAGAVYADAAYWIPDFLGLVGLKKGALSTLKRQGFKVRKAGGRTYVLGRDWIEFLSSQ